MSAIASRATELLRGRETTRCATSGREIGGRRADARQGATSRLTHRSLRDRHEFRSFVRAGGLPVLLILLSSLICRIRLVYADGAGLFIVRDRCPQRPLTHASASSVAYFA